MFCLLQLLWSFFVSFLVFLLCFSSHKTFFYSGLDAVPLEWFLLVHLTLATEGAKHRTNMRKFKAIHHSIIKGNVTSLADTRASLEP